jgi:hypothetical protein
MVKDLKAHDLEKLFRKLEIEPKSCSHHVRGFLVVDGKPVLPLHYSNGKKNLYGPNLHKFRKSLKLDGKQFEQFVKCTFSREDLIQVLRDKEVI